MRKIILYTAVSLDGQIAPPDGTVGWLERFPNPEKTDHGFAAFFDSIDTVLVGNKTYRQAMGFDIPAPFKGKRVYVFSRTGHEEPRLVKEAWVSYITRDPLPFIRSLRAAGGRDIWLCGGGQVNALLLSGGLIDEMILSYVPMLLGPGIPLLPSPAPETVVRLIGTKTWSSGVVQATYRLGEQSSFEQ